MSGENTQFPRFAAVGMVIALAPACGSGSSDVPPELLEAIRESERGSFGVSVGDRVENLCFEGWQDPSAAEYDTTRFETVCLHDYLDPAGERFELLLINAAALWCTACRVEYQGSQSRRSLTEHLAARQDAGFRILGTLFQDNAGEPADENDASAWARAYDVTFPFVLDPTFQLGAFTTPSQAPFNMLIDARTMEILMQLEGDQPAVLFGSVDALLAGRASGR